MAENIATKYRPKDLTEYVGNKQLKTEITRIIKGDVENLPKSFMFVGPSGCGKTTIARLLAKHYLSNGTNEEKLDKYIETGDTTELDNLMEIDVGQDRGIANMEAIKQDILVPSFDGSWKVYIFDEFHSSSKASQNSLLKLLEDTPEKVLMIFCTTNKNMVLPTILGRIQHIYTVRKPDSSELCAHLANICVAEKWKYDKRGLQEIAKLSGYQIRDAIRNMASVQETYGDITMDSVSAKFNLITDVYAQKFFIAYKNKDCIAGADVLYTIKQKFGIEPFYELLREYIKRGIYIRNGVLVQGFTKDELKSYKELFKNFTVAEISGMLSDLQKLTQFSGNEEDMEVQMIAMLTNGIMSSVPQNYQESTDTSPQRQGDKNKSYVDMKAIEQNKMQANIEEKKAEKKAVTAKQLESLSKIVKLTDHLERFGGKVYLITAQLPK